MRLIAVPLARIRPGATPVTTFLAQSAKAVAKGRPQNDAGSSSKTSEAIRTASVANTTASTSSPSTSTSSTKTSAVEEGKTTKSEEEMEEKPPFTKRMMNKASDFWINLGREDQISTFDWKRRTYNMGEKLMDRIDYEEWALKGVDPTLGPSLKPLEVVEKRKERKEGQDASKDVKQMTESSITPVAALNIPLLFPPSLVTSTSLLSSLRRMTASRQPHHRKRLLYCIGGMPLTIPFILIPVVPNLPFFYLVWRAWSHWRALSSSKYLSELISQGRIVPTPSEELDRILSSSAPPPSASTTQAEKPPPSIKSSEQQQQSKDDGAPKEKNIDYEPFMLLKKHTITDLVKTFKLDHQLSIDLARARQQTIKSIQAGKMERLEDEEAAGEGVKAHTDIDKRAKL